MKFKIIEILDIQLFVVTDDQFGIDIEVTYLVETDEYIDIITRSYKNPRNLVKDLNSGVLNFDKEN